MPIRFVSFFFLPDGANFSPLLPFSCPEGSRHRFLLYFFHMDAENPLTPSFATLSPESPSSLPMMDFVLLYFTSL